MAPVTGIRGCYDFRTFTPDFIKKETDDLIADQKSVYDEIGNLPIDNVAYSNVIKKLADAMCDRTTRGSLLDFPQHSATDKKVRDASCDSEQKLEEFDVEMSMRKDVFDRVVAFRNQSDFEGLNHEQKRFVNKLIRNGKRNGLHLSEEVRKEIKAVKTRMSELAIKFSRNLNEDDTRLFFSKDELDGMSDDFLNELSEGDEGKLEVTLKYPHLFPITKRCKIPTTRKLMVAANQAKCMEVNTPLLEELVELRQKQADLLGFKNHATYILEERMAKSPDSVKNFLEDLATKLQSLWKDEKELMLQLKEEECEKFGFKCSPDLEFWDIYYYMNKIEETKYSVDHNELRQFFPLEKVTKGLLEIYQLLLGLKFTLEETADTWHEDVKLYRVNDAKSDELLGYFYLDLHPREGKFGHAAVFPLQPSCIDSEEKRQISLCAMMCNFTKPTKDKPALLEHSEVVTYFHEFGHVMHNICSQAEIIMFSGTRTERDFLEAPSQMLENWCWEKEPLLLMSEHYESKKAIPDDLLNKLYKSKAANAGAFNLRQIILGLFDQRIHTTPKADTQKVFSDTYFEVLGIRPIENTNMPASFQHMAGGYDSQYYGYLWSEVFSMDMYDSCFKKEGILNAEVGAKYRFKVLKPGGSKDAIDLLVDFLGRKPNNEAFLRSKGLELQLIEL